MMREGTALVISAPSGAGKTTLCKMLLREFPNIHYSVSCTTRPRRKDEVEGRDYCFMLREEFEKKRDAGGFAEWAEVHGNLYGTPLEPVRARLEQGVDLLFDVDVQGAAQIRVSIPKACFAFIVPPSMRELQRRLRSRDLDNEENIKKRMRNARTELGEALWYDAIIVNDDLETAYLRLKSFYLASTLAPARNAGIVNSLLAEEVDA